MKTIYYVQLISFLLLSCSLLKAQPGTLDLSFNPNDVGFGMGDGAIYYDDAANIKNVAIQPDGKIIISGYIHSYNSYQNPLGNSGIVRLNTNGSIDSSFTLSGILTNQSILLFTLQPDGKILVVYSDNNKYFLKRFNSNGSEDNSFNTGSNGASHTIRAIAIQPDGKILIGGDFTSYNGTACNRIVRLNTNGSIDNTFNIGTGFNNSVYTISLTSSNKILVGGSFTQYNGTNKNAVVHLNADGSMALIQYNGFASGSTVKSILVESNGNIVFGGQFISYNGNTSYNMVRVNGLGTYDNTFVSGFSLSSVVYKIIKNPAGGYYVCGYIDLYAGTNVTNFVSINNDGTLQSSFYHGVFLGDISTIALQADNKIIVGGQFYTYDSYPTYSLTRLNTDGTRDEDFNRNYGLNKYPRDFAVLPDKKIIVGGAFVLYNERAVNFLVKIHENGEIDTTFNANQSGPNNHILSIAVQPDQKILIGGYFTSYNGVAMNCIARLNADGSIDSTFNIGSGANNVIQKILIQDDGKIVLVGFFTEFNGMAVKRIVRLNPNGSIDLTFNPGTGADGNIYTAALYPGGKILIAGAFGNYNNQSAHFLARINNDGSFDPTFNIGTGPNSYTNLNLSVQNDGKIYVGGSFTSFNNTNTQYFVRLNADGTIDSGFNQGFGFNGGTLNSLILNDGNILVSGNFSKYNNSNRPRLVMLAPNGMLNPSFNGGYASDNIYVMKPQGEGKIIIGGDFVKYNQIGRNRIARIFNCSHTTNTINITACDSYTAPDGQVYTTSGTYTSIIPNSTGCDSIITIHLTVNQSSITYTEYYVCHDNTFTAPDGQVYTSSGDYTAIIPNSMGCDSVIHFYLYITNFEATITVNNNTLYASPNYGGCMWLDCNNNYAPIPNANGPTFTPTQSGSYAVVVTTMECGSDTSNCINFTMNDVPNNSTTGAIRIYPNPVKDKLIIRFEDATNESYYEIFNSLGELVLENKLLPLTYIDVNLFKNGLYVVKVTQGNNTHYQKFIKN